MCMDLKMFDYRLNNTKSIKKNKRIVNELNKTVKFKLAECVGDVFIRRISQKLAQILRTYKYS